MFTGIIACSSQGSVCNWSIFINYASISEKIFLCETACTCRARVSAGCICLHELWFVMTDHAESVALAC